MSGGGGRSRAFGVLQQWSKRESSRTEYSVMPNSSEVGEGVFIVWVEIQPLPLATSAFCRGSRQAGRPAGTAGMWSGGPGQAPGVSLLWSGGARHSVRYGPGRPVSRPTHRAGHRAILCCAPVALGTWSGIDRAARRTTRQAGPGTGQPDATFGPAG